jgi:Rad3-related DNA helicase
MGEVVRQAGLELPKKVILTSATLPLKSLELLGLKPGEDLEYIEMPSTFSAARRPIYRVPCAAVRWNWGFEEQNKWLRMIDNIIGARLDRKGIVHSTSFKLRDLLMNRSRHKGIFITHGPGDAREVIEGFKKAHAPAVLLSPSIVTGFDFPGAECRYQIIGKVAFPNTQDVITKKRRDQDPEWYSFLAVLHMVQAYGRGCRSQEDWCETFVTDDQAGWFLKKNGGFAPKWFREAYKTVDVLPEPMLL